MTSTLQYHEDDADDWHHPWRAGSLADEGMEAKDEVEDWEEDQQRMRMEDWEDQRRMRMGIRRRQQDEDGGGGPAA